MNIIKKISIKSRLYIAVLLILLFSITISATGCAQKQQSASDSEKSAPTKTAQSLLVYAGSASKPPTEEAAKVFEQKTGIKIDLVFGGSGAVLSQMELNKKGDLYFPGSSDFMDKAKTKNLVLPDTEKRIVYLVSAINVQKGNPKGITGLKDLTKPGIKVAIANPETVCVGLYAVEIIENSLSPEEKAALKKNIINYTESCDKTATAISMKTVDAVIGWSVFQYWDPNNIETIPLNKDQVQRIGYIPIAISTFSKNKETAQKFIDFLDSKEGKAIFAKYHYFATAQEAKDYIGTDKPVGGEYTLPKGWVTGGS